jgi:hypothetical protein
MNCRSTCLSAGKCHPSWCFAPGRHRTSFSNAEGTEKSTRTRSSPFTTAKLNDITNLASTPQKCKNTALEQAVFSLTIACIFTLPAGQSSFDI